jgi:hypothetical protein
MGIAHFGEPAGRLRVVKTPNLQRVKRERVVNAYNRMFQEEQIPIETVIETVDARPSNDPRARTRRVSPAGIRASAASFPIRQPGAAPLPIALEGVADTQRHHHSRRSPPRTCPMLHQPVGRITTMHLSQAAPTVDMIPTTHMLLTLVSPALRMTEPASRAVRCVVEATPISPADMTSEIHAHHASRRRARPVRPITIGVNRD